MKKKILLLPVVALAFGTLCLSFNRNVSPVLAETPDSTTTWTSLNSEVLFEDVEGTTDTIFKDSVDAGWSSTFYDGGVLNEKANLRDYIYNVTITTEQLASNGSFYLTLSNSDSPWTSTNWSVGAIIVQVDFWGQFPWDASANGAARISVISSISGVDFGGATVDTYIGATGGLKIGFDVKASGTIIRINDENKYESSALTTRNSYDYWSNYVGTISFGPQATRTASTEYRLSVSKQVRTANYRVENAGEMLTAITADGGVQLTDTQTVGWASGACYQGAVYDDLLDTTKDIEINVKSLSADDNNSSIYLILNNNLKEVSSNVAWYNQYCGLRIAYYGWGWRYVKLAALNTFDVADPALALTEIDSSIPDSGLNIKFSVKDTTTEIYVDGNLTFTLSCGNQQIFSYGGNKAQLSFGPFEQRNPAFNYGVTVKNTANTYAAEYFVRTYMHEEVAPTESGSGACVSSNWFSTAKVAYNGLSDEVKATLAQDVYSNYIARLSAWAIANGETLSNGVISSKTNLFINSTESSMVFVWVMLTVCLAFALAIIIKKFKKVRND